MNVSVPTMLLTIVARGKASKVLELFEKNGVFFTNILHGNGTASSEILDILGLDTAEKDILISPATHHSAVAIMNEFNDRLGGYNYGKGIACRLRLNAITNLVYKSMEVTSKKMEEQKMTNSEEQYSLIIISVNQGYADEVMAVAKKAGARGGTLVRGRQMETEPTQGLFGSGFAREREIIFILVNNQNRKDILNSINVEHGVRSEACATVFALGVEEIAKLT